MKTTMVRNSDWDKWKDAGMIYNRYREVVAHRKLIKMVEADDLDIDGVRTILKELITVAMPVSASEMEVIMRIEAEQAGQKPEAGSENVDPVPAPSR